MKKNNENIVFSFFKKCDSLDILTISFKKDQNVQKLFFHEKSMFSRPLSKQISFFKKNKKVLLRLTSQRKTSKIMKIICFSWHFSLEISTITNFYILWNSVKYLWHSTNKLSIFCKLLKKMLFVAFPIRKCIITNVDFSQNYNKTPLIAHCKLVIIVSNIGYSCNSRL